MNIELEHLKTIGSILETKAKLAPGDAILIAIDITEALNGNGHRPRSAAIVAETPALPLTTVQEPRDRVRGKGTKRLNYIISQSAAGKTKTEIAKNLGISASRVSQILAENLSKTR